MRKITTAALAALALCLIFGAGSALAGDCCDKCKPCKTSCNDGCKKACDSCKPKCSPCKPKCEPCKPKCDPCKPKCNPCAKPKCGGCDKCAKPKCGGCGKCGSCKPSCGGCGKCGSCKPDCWGDKGSYWSGDACCPPKQGVQEICLSKCGCGGDGCSDCSGRAHHPYERCWNGSSMMCDTGCCTAYLPCKRKCVTCETVCKEVESTDCCGCKTKHYVYETVCHEVKRPTVIPWWFNEKGAGNIYVEEKAEASKTTADSGEASTETASSGWSGGSEG